MFLGKGAEKNQAICELGRLVKFPLLKLIYIFSADWLFLEYYISMNIPFVIDIKLEVLWDI